MATFPVPTIIQQRSCPHCKAEGTCKQSSDSQSCATCVKQYGRTRWQRWFGITPKDIDLSPKTCVCSICNGRGFVEGATFKFRNYFPFLFALLFVTFCFLLFGFQPAVTEKLQSALTTILGTIVGFYFGGKRSDV